MTSAATAVVALAAAIPAAASTCVIATAVSTAAGPSQGSREEADMVCH